MADSTDMDSDGSDIEVDLNNEFDTNTSNLNEENGEDGFECQQRTDDEWFRGFFESDGEHDEFEGFDVEWKTSNFDERNERTYSEIGGSTFVHPEDALPHNYFELIWGQDLWQHMVTETNRYAEQERTRNPPPPFAPRWVPVDIPAMKAFIGLCFCMGVLRLPSRNDYWRVKKRMFRTAFNTIMPRDKFNLIWRYLHLTNNDAPPPARPDKLKKIRWFLNYLNDKFKAMYTPYKHVTVDESMVKFKGRLGFRQYMPLKPTKWGIKVWTLTESETGYIHQFQVYTGKEENQEKGLSHRVVTDLIGHLNHTNIRVFMDNYYTSPALLTDLHMRGVYACGTVRNNRKGLPTALLPRNVMLDKHEFLVAQKDELSCCIWQDTKCVMVLSNFHSPNDMGTVNRRSGNPTQQSVEVPKMLADYQKFMKGVDLSDQMIGYHIINHRSRKWWRRLFFHFMMGSALNAYIIAKDSNPETVGREWPNIQDFVDYCAGKDAPILDTARPARVHTMERLFEKEKVCVECRAKANRGERVGTSKFGCVECNVPVHHQCFPAHINRANKL
ncbi:piggyBac transposable element-derived protein 4-like [Dreissena polymorpha]|uniref:piggyBac transposable element-derived protein 4-like n=1 Tax=Dreissena polymorpha TaxID=45954 RepID=UPI002263EA45|nr:piggyBac transposable element-derived protein 4-like [Dreissena polymorpha]